MRREHLLARLLRALSGKTQEQAGRDLGVHPSLVAQFERGLVVPSRDHLTRLAQGAELTLGEAEEVLRLAETLQGGKRRRSSGAPDLLDDLVQNFRALGDATFRRLQALSPPTPSPREEDRGRAAEQWGRLENLSDEIKLAVVRVADEYQTWALCERVCEESVKQASRDLSRAASLAKLAQEIAELVREPEGWRSCLRSYALAHRANVLRVSGDLAAADARMTEAEILWQAGIDPGRILDPGRIPCLKAALRRDQRRLDEALALLDHAADVGRRPDLALIQKGFTLEVMGEYQLAIDSLLAADPLVDRQAEPRLGNVLRVNLAFNFCHVGRYAEAAKLLEESRPLAAELGDEIDLLRMLWLEGRIAVGLRNPEKAHRAFEQARLAFASRGMATDAALVLLEEAVLLLDENRTAEVKVLARHLATDLDGKGVHREARTALEIFRQAAEREEATAELGRRVFSYLLRARHDASLRFNS